MKRDRVKTKSLKKKSILNICKHPLLFHLFLPLDDSYFPRSPVLNVLSDWMILRDCDSKDKLGLNQMLPNFMVIDVQIAKEDVQIRKLCWLLRKRGKRLIMNKKLSSCMMFKLSQNLSTQKPGRKHFCSMCINVTPRAWGCVEWELNTPCSQLWWKNHWGQFEV